MLPTAASTALGILVLLTGVAAVCLILDGSWRRPDDTLHERIRCFERQGFVLTSVGRAQGDIRFDA